MFGSRKLPVVSSPTPFNVLKNEGIKMDEHRIPLRELYERLGTSPINGLSSEQAEANLKNYGLNEIRRRAPITPKWSKITQHLFGGFSMMLWAGSFLCFFAYSMEFVGKTEDRTQDNLYLGCVILCVVIGVGIVTYTQERRTERVMNSFLKLSPSFASVIRDGNTMSVPVERLTLGDLIVIEYGTKIPADIRIIEANEFKVNNGNITGEADSVRRTPEFTNHNPLESANMIFSSTLAVEGNAKGIVIKTGSKTVMGRLAKLTTEMPGVPKAIGRELKLFVGRIAIFAICVGSCLFIITLSMGHTWIHGLIFFIGITVANVPEGLLLTVIVALVLTAMRLRKKNCLVKNLEAVETLGACSIILTDKTGTLTENLMKVTTLWFDLEIHPALNPETNKHEMMHGYRIRKAFASMCRCASLCNRAHFQSGQDNIPILQRQVQGDLTESALLKYMTLCFPDLEESRKEYTKICEIPFHSTIKYQMSVHLHQEEKGYLVLMKGAPERVIEKCANILIKNKSYVFDETVKKIVTDACNDMARRGERVIAFCELALPKHKYFVYPDGEHYDFDCGTVNFPFENMLFLGLMGLSDPIRPNVPDAIAKCRSAGIKVIMVTGDHPVTAEVVARTVGIISEDRKIRQEFKDIFGKPIENLVMDKDEGLVIDGKDLSLMSEETLKAFIKSHDEIVFCRTTPEQKMIVCEACQQLGHYVAVTGDGVNDVSALKKADIGISMGIAGSDVTKEVADLILLDDNFATVVNGIEEGRLIFDNLKKSIAYTLTSNIPEIVPFLLFVLGDLPLPLGTVTILLIDLGTDLFPAISLVYEAPEEDIMTRLPRRPDAHTLVNRRLIALSYGQIGTIQAVAGLFTYFVVMTEHGFFPLMLFGIRHQWENMAELKDGYNQTWSHERRQDLLHTTQTAVFVAIVVVQWADLIISKTRRRSIRTQGMRNWFLNIALVAETVIALLICYVPSSKTALNTYPIKVWWWFISVPFAIYIFIYDETRRYIMRRFPYGWVERETLY